MSLKTDFDAVLELTRPGRTMYHDAHYLAATLEVDPERMRRFLPWGVTLAQPHRADLFCAWFPDNTFSPGYLEAGLFVHVKTIFGTGIHCPWMVVDDDNALILGRESAGYPKKLATLSWENTGDVITAGASRRGATLVEMTARLGAPVADKPQFLGRPHRNVIGLMGTHLPLLVAFTPREEVLEVRDADIDLRVSGSTRDPLHEMGLGEIVHARLHRVNLGGVIPPLPIKPISPLFTMRHLNLRTL